MVHGLQSAMSFSSYPPTSSNRTSSSLNLAIASHNSAPSASSPLATPAVRRDLEMDCLNDGELGEGCRGGLPPFPRTPTRRLEQRARACDHDDTHGRATAVAAPAAAGRGGCAACAPAAAVAASSAAREAAALRYSDVDLLLGLCAATAPVPAPAAPPARAGARDEGGAPPSADSDDSDDTLALLLKYTHVVGAS
jgi:hypothetical protein